MIIFSLIYICTVIFLVILFGLIIKAKKENIFISILCSIVGVPVVFGLLLFVFKTPIQEGRLLQNTSVGPLLNLISPPVDLYTALGSVELVPEKTEYIIKFSHKYSGNHALKVSSPKPAREEHPKYSDITVSLTVSDGEKILLRIRSDKIGQFTGRDDYGAFFALYQVPKDLPVAKELKVTAKISGNLTGFLERRGETTLKIQKYSDE